MSDDHARFDRLAEAWLAEGPTELADRVLDAALDEVHTTRQRRVWSASWKGATMNQFAAAVAAVLVVAVAGAIYLQQPGSGVGQAPPTVSPSVTAPPSPEATAAPSVSRTIIDRTTEAGYTITVPETWHSRVIETGLNNGTGLDFSLPVPLVSGSITEGGVEAGSDPPEFTIGLGAGTGGTYSLHGHDLTELLASVDAFYEVNWSTHPTAPQEATVDGEPAWITETTVAGPATVWADALVIHGDLALYVSLSAPPENAAALRTSLDELLASMRWTD